jgi:phosphatidate cytidylyltransferase
VLKQRLITAAVLIPVVVASVVWLPKAYFAVLFGLFALAAAWEWAGFTIFNAPAPRAIYTIAMLVLLVLSWMFVSDSLQRVIVVLVMGLLWWLAALMLVVLYPRHENIRKNPAISAVAGILVIVPCWLALITLHGTSIEGAELVLFLLASIAVADSGAYFGGRRWGTNKLAPQVSPGKTWEGVISGLLCVGVFAFICAWLFTLVNTGWEPVMLFVGVSLLTALFSVLGDLTESMYKRQVGLKDSGSILPGHGGVLDRIDSITAAAPVFVICLWLLFW